MPPSQPPVTVPPTTGDTPDEQLIALRARWFATLTAEQRDRLADLPLREVERIFARWREEQEPAEQ